MELIEIDRRDSSVETKLKCKHCRLFFRDNGHNDRCPQCGLTLKRITVHKIKPENMKVISKRTKIGAKK